MGKAAIFNPYLDTLGGGERYTLSFAKVLADEGWVVDVEWKDIKIKEKLEERLGINLSNINFVPDIKKGSGYDLCFWVSDGSIPLLHSRKNILHFQVPFHDVDGRSLFNRMKLIRVNKIVCNSKFTKNVIDREFGVGSIVIYPPVDVFKIKPKRKENIILYVGRFSKLVQSKRQDVLIDAFKKFSKKVPDWKLVLVGGSDIGGKEYIKELKNKSIGYNIEILEGIPYNKELLDIYGKTRFFWSAAGYEINENLHPEQVEHFGITTVEAMVAGAVPLAFNAGGSKEIIKSKENGFLWKSINELIKITMELSEDRKLWKKLSDKASENSFLFGNEMFSRKVIGLL